MMCAACYRAPSTYTKSSYGRGAGIPLQCGSGYFERSGLCYANCASGYVPALKWIFAANYPVCCATS